jgi:Tfp pilus assembly protein PilF
MKRAVGSVLLALSLCVSLARAEAPMTPQARAARLIGRGDQLRAAGDSVSASAFYRDAISVAPREPAAYLALGEIYTQAGELAHAEEVFRVGLRYAGEQVELLLGLVRAYERNGAPVRALESLRTFTHAHPGEPALHAEHGRCAEALGRFTEALSARRMELTARIQSDNDERARLEVQGRIRALEQLVASSDRARSAQLCALTSSPVRRALARCP